MIFFPPEKIGEMIKSFEQESKALSEQIVEICYLMGGGIDYNTAWGMSFLDREIAIKVINKKLKEKNPGGKEYM